MRKALAAGLVLALLGTPASSQSTSADALAKGIREVGEGSYGAAAATLDSAIRELGKDPARAKDLGRAYLYLGVAHAGLKQDQAARADFCRAKRQDPSLRLDVPNAPASAAALFAEPCSTTSGSASPAPKKGGSKTLPILIGVGAAAAIGIAVAAGGGDNGPTSSTVGVRRDAVFAARPQCAQVVGGACTSAANAHEVMVSAGGVLEATLIADNPGARLFLRALSPSNRMIEAGPSGTTLRIPAEAGRWVLTVWQQGKAAGEVRYQLRVSFP